MMLIRLGWTEKGGKKRERLSTGYYFDVGALSYAEISHVKPGHEDGEPTDRCGTFETRNLDSMCQD